MLLIEPDREVHAFQQILPTGVDRVEADRSWLARIDGVDQRADVDVAVIDTASEARGSRPRHELTGAPRRAYR